MGIFTVRHSCLPNHKTSSLAGLTLPGKESRVLETGVVPENLEHLVTSFPIKVEKGQRRKLILKVLLFSQGRLF